MLERLSTKAAASEISEQPAQHQGGTFDEAVADFSKVIELRPSYGNAWFNRGEIRSVDDCLEIVRTYSSESAATDPRWLQPIGRRELLARMLRNLKHIYARQDNEIMYFKMIHWILTLQPDALTELSARAMLYEAMGNPALAVKDWERYIANIGDPASVTKIRARIDYLKNQRSRIH